MRSTVEQRWTQPTSSIKIKQINQFRGMRSLHAMQSGIEQLSHSISSGHFRPKHNSFVLSTFWTTEEEWKLETPDRELDWRQFTSLPNRISHVYSNFHEWECKWSTKLLSYLRSTDRISNLRITPGITALIIFPICHKPHIWILFNLDMTKVFIRW
jgi:hypothetical protein